MKLKSYCAFDLHHKHTVFEAQSPNGGVVLHRDMPTERGQLVAALKAVPGPKGVVLEEGPMADWAMRVMKPFATEVIVCDPRRNRLIAEDGDKTDDIDPGKLIDLYRVGVLRPVHHPERQSMMDLRGWVWAYHDQVELVTAAKNKIKADLRGAGLQYGEEDVYSVEGRAVWLDKLSRRSVRERLEVRYGNLDSLVPTRDKLYERLCRIARRHPVARRFLKIPGYGVIRAMTFLVMVDTPFRFSSPQKLWRYAGLGLRRKQSGEARRGDLRPDQQYNRRLKVLAKGAMEMAVKAPDGNPFAAIYRRLMEKGVKNSLARLTVARKMLSVPWAMWKTGSDYNPALVT